MLVFLWFNQLSLLSQYHSLMIWYQDDIFPVLIRTNHVLLQTSKSLIIVPVYTCMRIWYFYNDMILLQWLGTSVIHEAASYTCLPTVKIAKHVPAFFILSVAKLLLCLGQASFAKWTYDISHKLRAQFIHLGVIMSCIIETTLKSVVFKITILTVKTRFLEPPDNSRQKWFPFS